MSMTGDPGDEVTFTCGNPKCKQIWTVHNVPDGPATYCLVLKTLWPQGMKEDSTMFRDQYMPAWLEERRHRAAMFEIGGFWSPEKAEIWLCEVKAAYSRWFRDHPQRRSWWHWWQFWKRGKA